MNFHVKLEDVWRFVVYAENSINDKNDKLFAQPSSVASGACVYVYVRCVHICDMLSHSISEFFMWSASNQSEMMIGARTASTKILWLSLIYFSLYFSVSVARRPYICEKVKPFAISWIWNTYTQQQPHKAFSKHIKVIRFSSGFPSDAFSVQKNKKNAYSINKQTHSNHYWRMWALVTWQHE